MAAPSVNGTPINFGFSGSIDGNGNQGITLTGVTGVLLQTADQSKVATRTDIQDGNGNDVVHVWSNQHDEASLEWIVSGSNLAGAITNTTFAKLPGSILAISGCASMPSLVGTCWEVQSGVKISGSNTGAKKVTLPIHLYAGITGAAS